MLLQSSATVYSVGEGKEKGQVRLHERRTVKEAQMGRTGEQRGAEWRWTGPRPVGVRTVRLKHSWMFSQASPENKTRQTDFSFKGNKMVNNSKKELEVMEKVGPALQLWSINSSSSWSALNKPIVWLLNEHFGVKTTPGLFLDDKECKLSLGTKTMWIKAVLN